MKKYKKAQHLVEFALISPVLIIFFVFIAEVGFAINTRIALAEAVKVSLSKVNLMVGSSETNIKTAIETSIKTYMSSHNFPDANTVTVEIYDPTAGNGEETALVSVSYKYHPFFNFLSFFGNNIIPKEIIFYSFQVFNSTLLKANDLSSAFSSADLDAFSKDSSILKDQIVDGIDFRRYVALLVGFDTSAGTTNYNFARLYNWWGQDLLPQNLAFNIQTGHLEVKTPYFNSGVWFDTQIPFTWVLTSLGFTHAIYSRMGSNMEFSNYKMNLASITASGDISGTTYDNYINKRALNLYLDDSLTTSYGGFDLVNSLGVANDDIKAYAYQYSSKYVLRLFIPTSTRPVDPYNGFRFLFDITSDGIYNSDGSSTNIVECYIDSDGDGIPDPWDSDREYPDADGNGILDGQQTTAPVFSSIFPDTAVITAPSGTVTIAPAYRTDGVTLNSHTPNSYAPASYSVAYGKYGSALYFQQSGTTYTRKMTMLGTLTDADYYIYGGYDGTTIYLYTSGELILLYNDAFSLTNKVTH